MIVMSSPLDRRERARRFEVTGLVEVVGGPEERKAVLFGAAAEVLKDQTPETSGASHPKNATPDTVSAVSGVAERHDRKLASWYD